MNRYADDDGYGDWMYEQIKDRKMDADCDAIDRFNTERQFYEQSINPPSNAAFAALRRADKMLAIAAEINDKRIRESLTQEARQLQERADRKARAWA